MERALSRKPRVQRKRPRRANLAAGDRCGDNGALKMERMFNELRAELTTANLLLVAFLFVLQTLSVAYSVLEVESTAAFELLATFGTLYAFGYWLEIDNRKHNFRWPYCRGVFLYIASLLLIPYYLFKTRGKYALLLLLIFLCLYILASLTGVLVAGFFIASRFD